MASQTARLSRVLLLTLALPFSFLSITTQLPSRGGVPEPSAGQVAQNAAEVQTAYGRIPLSFEANRGQTGASVDFLARGAGYSLFLRPTEATFILSRQRAEIQSDDDAGTSAGAMPSASKLLRMKLVGASEAAAVGTGERPGRVNYLVGDDPSKWRAGVPTYAGVRYDNVYPGIDLVYYGNQRQLEYDFRLAPGADPRAVSLEFEGADKVELDAAGDLVLTLGRGVVRQPKPFIYQEVAGARQPVEGGYKLDADGRVRFALGEYDARLPLVIDPVIVYSTYLGGSSNEFMEGVAIDSAGSAYLAGFTASTDYPTANALQPGNLNGDIVITKLNPAGTALVYSTYLGGSEGDRGWDIAVDPAGNVYLTGETTSTDFPVVNAFQPALAPVVDNTRDAFVTKLNPTGSALVYSTYLGGTSPQDVGYGIAVDPAGSAYVTGDTGSRDFPVTAGAIKRTKGEFGGDAFVTKLTPAGNALAYSTYLGGELTTGAGGSDGGRDIAVDCAGNAYVTGYTFSTNFPVTAGAFQLTYVGAPRGAEFEKSDAFVSKLNTSGTALVYSTYLGGDKRDEGQAIAIDAAGNAYVTGLTLSFNFPTANAIQPVNNAVAGVAEEAFVSKLNASGSALVYSTYLGGGSGEVAQGIALDAGGNAYVTGVTGSTNFPTVNPVQNALSGGSDAFVTKVNAAGTAFAYSTYLGGSASGGDEQGIDIAVDSAGIAYVVGLTGSTDFPTVNPFQATKAGAGPPFPTLDGFVTKIAEPTTGAASQFLFTQTATSVQEDLTFVTMTVQRTGDTSQAATVNYETADGTASERKDYTTAVGTLRFAAGETSKTFDLLINEDSFVEGAETFTVALSNATGGATLSCGTAVATVQINDDALEPTANVVDDASVFVRQHYHDFLNREADAPGLAFWSGQITACGADAACIDRTRASVSQAFFLSIEFQTTGYFVFRIYKATFTDTPARPRGMPRYRELLRDTQEVGRGVVVGQGSWQVLLEANRREFTRQWVERPDFVAQFSLNMTADEYINKLAANLGVTLTPTEFNIAFESYAQTVEGRATTLRSIIESGSVYNRQFNAAFVLSQYIGYLRRNPNDAPDADYSGFDFWLVKMDSFSLPGENVRDEQVAISRAQRAEMVRAFILSAEYRNRFGQ